MRRARKGIAVILVAFAALNILILAIFASRTYPRTYIGPIAVGNTSYKSLPQKIGDRPLLPPSIQLTYKDKKESLAPTDLGLSTDPSLAAQNAGQANSPLPLVNVFTVRHIPLPLQIDEAAFSKKTAQLQSTFSQPEQSPQVKLMGSSFGVADAQSGHQLDSARFMAAVKRQVAAGQSTIEVPVAVLQPKQTKITDDLKASAAAYNKQLTTKIIFRYKDQNRTVPAKDIASWYAPDATGYYLSDQVIRDYITKVADGFNVKLQNTDKLVQYTKNSVLQNKALDTSLSGFSKTKNFTYCAAVLGLDENNLADFKSKLAGTYADPRGWSLDGQVSFTLAQSGCDFTATLTAPGKMSTFGAICDPVWSCSIGNNVVINYERWSHASDPWNDNGGSLEDYRSMAINHETGHWLGFPHLNCPAPGALAPVMAQQSVDLQGCRFNPWPIEAEKDQLRKTLGL
jgi:hypothetical protein